MRGVTLWIFLLYSNRYFSAFSDLYHKDKAQFGDPAISGIKAAEVQDLDNGQVFLQAHTRNVVPPKQKLDSKKRKDHLE